MISATKKWLRRNRNGIAIGAGVIGATYLAGQYVLSKINDARERMQLDRIAKENIRRRFEQNQVDCTITVLALLPTLSENVLEALSVEHLTHELQQKKMERLARAAGEAATSEASSQREGETASLSSFHTDSFLQASEIDSGSGQPKSRKSKAQLWNEIKVTSITRAMTLIYSLSLLTLLTRIQLNLLGRLNYLSSVVSMAQPVPPERRDSISLEDHDVDFATSNFGNDFETNRKFLTFSWHLLHRGYAQILNRVKAAVAEVFDGISPNEGLTSVRLSQLILETRKKVEGSTEHERYAIRWLPYVLPKREMEESLLVESGIITPPSTASSPEAFPDSNRPIPDTGTASGPLRRLLDESADLIDSPTFTRVHTLLLNAMFSHLIDEKVIRQSYPQPPVQSPPSSVSGIFQPPEPRIQELDSSVTVVPGDPRVKLANILAIITRQAHVIGNGNNPPNEYVDAMNANVKELEAFAAVIYASNLEQGLEQPRDNHAGSRTDVAQGTSGDGHPSVDELTDSKLESAWEKVTSSVISSRG